MAREITALLLLSFLSSFGGIRGDLKEYPENVAVTQGDTVILKCGANPQSRIMWREYTLTYKGFVISDMRVITENHPNAARYSIVGNTTEHEFHLRIENVTAADGGKYSCNDIYNVSPSVFTRYAELVVFAGQQVCKPLTHQGNPVEGYSYTTHCQVNYTSATIAPEMEWSGPVGTYQANKTATTRSLSSYMTFTAHRSLEGETFRCKTYFHSVFPLEESYADNVPDYVDTYSMSVLKTWWPPGNITAAPLLSEYTVGDEITCWADANPQPAYHWRRWIADTRYNITDGPRFVMKQDMVGYNTTLICVAENLISGFVYQNKLTITAYVTERPSDSTITTRSASSIVTSEPSTRPTTALITSHWQSAIPPQHESVMFHSLSFASGILLGAAACMMGLLGYKLLSAAKRKRAPPYEESFKDVTSANAQI